MYISKDRRSKGCKYVKLKAKNITMSKLEVHMEKKKNVTLSGNKSPRNQRYSSCARVKAVEGNKLKSAAPHSRLKDNIINAFIKSKSSRTVIKVIDKKNRQSHHHNVSSISTITHHIYPSSGSINDVHLP